ncbi:unannotated protein [freshwater metagenome]|uniref:Unannotated protein n=1 Tax=freshwater metagenome TaxID=449393 RepID=A0A6J6HHE0_9ZZZZ
MSGLCRIGFSIRRSEMIANPAENIAADIGAK